MVITQGWGTRGTKRWVKTFYLKNFKQKIEYYKDTHLPPHPPAIVARRVTVTFRVCLGLLRKCFKVMDDMTLRSAPFSGISKCKSAVVTSDNVKTIS